MEGEDEGERAGRVKVGEEVEGVEFEEDVEEVTGERG
jgi:hypothetical protein